MIDGALLVLVIIAALGAALNGGIFFAFSTFVMSALRQLPPGQGLSTMQGINVTAVTPPFMSVLFGTALIGVVASIWTLTDWQGAASLLVLVGTFVYLGGVIGMTARFNVPRNNALAVVDPAEADAGERWHAYNRSWTVDNYVRTVACLAAAVLLMLATVR